MTSKSECEHNWLMPFQRRTTCIKCGRDGYLMMDVDPAAEIEGLKEIMAGQARDLIETLEARDALKARVAELEKPKRNLQTVDYAKSAEYITTEVINKLRARITELEAALEFYACRTVYERMNQFPEDDEFVECDDIAQEALAKKDGGV